MFLPIKNLPGRQIMEETTINQPLLYLAELPPRKK